MYRQTNFKTHTHTHKQRHTQTIAETLSPPESGIQTHTARYGPGKAKGLLGKRSSMPFLRQKAIVGIQSLSLVPGIASSREAATARYIWGSMYLSVLQLQCVGKP